MRRRDHRAGLLSAAARGDTTRRPYVRQLRSRGPIGSMGIFRAYRLSRDRDLASFPRERTWLLPALHADPARGALDLRRGARRRRRSPARAAAARPTAWPPTIPEFRLVAPGRRVARVCVGVPCRVQGSARACSPRSSVASVSGGGTTAGRRVDARAARLRLQLLDGALVEVDGRHLGRVAPGDVEQVLGAPAPDRAPAEARGDDGAALRCHHVPDSTPSPLRPPASPGPAIGQAVDPARWFAALERAAPRARAAPARSASRWGWEAAASRWAPRLDARRARRRGRAPRPPRTRRRRRLHRPLLGGARRHRAASGRPHAETATRVDRRRGRRAPRRRSTRGAAWSPPDVTAFLAGQRRVLTEPLRRHGPGRHRRRDPSRRLRDPRRAPSPRAARKP